jgi:hypothetical protein
MKETPQTDTQSVYEHGVSVKSYLFDLLDHLREDKPLKHGWKIPEWVYKHKDLLLNNLPSDETLSLYTLNHDIGKPFCIEYDTEGRRHFPNHAEVSYNVFKQHFNDPIAAELIRRDMDFHLLKADTLKQFSEYKYCTALILTGLAELHSNAKMFANNEDSPLDSVGFKIKWKNANKRGRQVLELLTNKNK